MTSYVLKSTANNSYKWVIVRRSHKLNIGMTHRMSHRKSEGLRISMTRRMSHNEWYLNTEALRQKGRHREVWRRQSGKGKSNNGVQWVWSKGKEKERKKMRGIHNITLLLGLKSQTTTPKFQCCTPRCLHEGTRLDQWDFHWHIYHHSCLLLQ